MRSFVRFRVIPFLPAERSNLFLPVFVIESMTPRHCNIATTSESFAPWAHLTDHA